MKQLCSIRGFLPYLLVVFINAFVDLGHKIVIQNTIFKTWDGEFQVMLTALINGLILLPFVLLFTPAGFLADRFAKPRVLRHGALAAVAGTALIALSYVNGRFELAFGLTLLLSIQSAIYSPAKYGYIRELVGDQHLGQGNAWVQAITIVAILSATFVFSALFEHYLEVAGLTAGASASAITSAIAPLGGVLVLLSLLEWWLAARLPMRKAADDRRRLSAGAYLRGRYLRRNIRVIREQRGIWLAIVGLSMFWAISQVMLAAFPAWAKAALGESNTLVIQGLLACSGVGILFGSVLAGRASRAHIELGLVPLGAIGIALTLALLPALESAFAIAGLFLLLGVCGGFFIVPLNALIQYRARPARLGTVLAGSNWVQNLSMLGFLLLTVGFALAGFDAEALLYLLVATAVAGALYSLWQLPQSLVRLLVGVVLKRRYRVNVIGFEQLPKEGAVLLLGNHISWIDWAVVQIACARPIRFVMAREIYQTWYLKPFLKAFGAIPISAGRSREALAEVNRCLQNGEVVCLFPEGAISRNGQLGTFKAGYERTVEGVDGVILPFYLRGLWGSRLSRAENPKLRENAAWGLKRDVIVAFGAPLPLTTPCEQLKQKVAELSVSAWEGYTETLDPLPLAWLKQARRNLRAPSLIDSSGSRYSNARVMAGTLAIAREMRRISSHRSEPQLGLMLPASAAGVMANLAVMFNGQTAVNLNFTAGVEAVQAAIRAGEIRTVYTSSRFAKKLAAKGVDLEAMLAGTRVVWLEQLQAGMSRGRLLRHLLAAILLPAALLYRLQGRVVGLESPAQILFSSGSEGTPKGVVLTHRNLMGNIKQVSDVLNTRSDDVMMASLPLFHSFGLTVNSLLPMVEGIPAVCHPDPTDARKVARAIATHRATILCGTATFLRLYARNRKVHPLLLESLRVVVAGAEKLTPDVREAFELKFGKRIYEGYGATETAPVASVNVPDALDRSSWTVQVGHKPGSVGQALPGSCFRIVDPDTLATLPTGEAGLVLVSGGQVMQGYLKAAEQTAAAIIELEGRRWYKTGDKGYLDGDGFLTLVDRYSRFAKIGGEMISLGAVEAAVRELVDEASVECAATSVGDARKGEKIVLLITAGAGIDTLRQRLIESGMNPLLIPAQMIEVDALPRLGSGKIDYAGLKRLAA